MKEVQNFILTYYKLKTLGSKLLEPAYSKFTEKYGYDPRKNGDSIHSTAFFFEDNKFVFIFREITQHDQPFRVRLYYSADKVQKLLEEHGLTRNMELDN